MVADSSLPCLTTHDRSGVLENGQAVPQSGDNPEEYNTQDKWAPFHAHCYVGLGQSCFVPRPHTAMYLVGGQSCPIAFNLRAKKDYPRRSAMATHIPAEPSTSPQEAHVASSPPAANVPNF